MEVNYLHLLFQSYEDACENYEDMLEEEGLSLYGQDEDLELDLEEQEEYDLDYFGELGPRPTPRFIIRRSLQVQSGLLAFYARRRQGSTTAQSTAAEPGVREEREGSRVDQTGARPPLPPV